MPFNVLISPAADTRGRQVQVGTPELPAAADTVACLGRVDSLGRAAQEVATCE